MIFFIFLSIGLLDLIIEYVGLACWPEWARAFLCLIIAKNNFSFCMIEVFFFNFIFQHLISWKLGFKVSKFNASGQMTWVTSLID